MFAFLFNWLCFYEYAFYLRAFMMSPDQSIFWNHIKISQKINKWLQWFPICCSVGQSFLTVWDPMDCSKPGFPFLHYLWSLLRLMSTESVMPSNRLILCCTLLLLPSIIPSIRVFSNESVVCIRWPRYWSFSFSISPSNEYSGLISFRMDG